VSLYGIILGAVWRSMAQDWPICAGLAGLRTTKRFTFRRRHVANRIDIGNEFRFEKFLDGNVRGLQDQVRREVQEDPAAWP